MYRISVSEQEFTLAVAKARTDHTNSNPPLWGTPPLGEVVQRIELGREGVYDEEKFMRLLEEEEG